jgi:site-specific recombinase
MSDDFRFTPESIEAISKLFKSALSTVQQELAFVKSELKCHTEKQDERDEKINTMIVTAAQSIEMNRDTIRKINDIPEMVHQASLDFFRPEVKRLDEKIDGVKSDLKTHLDEQDRTKKLYQKSLAVAIGTSIVLAIIAVLGFFGIRIPGAKP